VAEFASNYLQWKLCYHLFWKHNIFFRNTVNTYGFWFIIFSSIGLHKNWILWNFYWKLSQSTCKWNYCFKIYWCSFMFCTWCRVGRFLQL